MACKVHDDRAMHLHKLLWIELGHELLERGADHGVTRHSCLIAPGDDVYFSSERRKSTSSSTGVRRTVCPTEARNQRSSGGDACAAALQQSCCRSVSVANADWTRVFVPGV